MSLFVTCVFIFSYFLWHNILIGCISYKRYVSRHRSFPFHHKHFKIKILSRHKSRSYERGYKRYIVPGPVRYWDPGG